MGDQAERVTGVGPRKKQKIDGVLGSMGAMVGLASFGVLLAMVAGILRQLGAGDAARALVLVTVVFFTGVAAFTYVPFLIAGE